MTSIIVVDVVVGGFTAVVVVADDVLAVEGIAAYVEGIVIHEVVGSLVTEVVVA